MTRHQKTILALLALANVTVMALLATFVVRSIATLPPPVPRLTLAVPGECAWQAAQHMASAGLSGAVDLTPDGVLQFTLAYPPVPEQPPDEAAQWVWDAFDVALSLRKNGCSFTRVHVAVRTPHGADAVWIVADVNAADLVAFGAGEMEEEAFIERVIYIKDPNPDEPEPIGSRE